MIVTLRIILYILALGCFIASAFGVSSRVNLQSAGLALIVLAFMAA